MTAGIPKHDEQSRLKALSDHQMLQPCKMRKVIIMVITSNNEVNKETSDRLSANLAFIHAGILDPSFPNFEHPVL